MLWVSDSPVPRWPPCADVLDSAVRHLVFIYIYDNGGVFVLQSCRISITSLQLTSMVVNSAAGVYLGPAYKIKSV